MFVVPQVHGQHSWHTVLGELHQHVLSRFSLAPPQQGRVSWRCSGLRPRGMHGVPGRSWLRYHRLFVFINFSRSATLRGLLLSRTVNIWLVVCNNMHTMWLTCIYHFKRWPIIIVLKSCTGAVHNGFINVCTYIYIRYVFMIITGPGVEVNTTNISNLPVYGMRVPWEPMEKLVIS